MDEPFSLKSSVSLLAFRYLFDWKYYIEHNPDLAEHQIDNEARAISHWILAGRAGKRSCGLKGLEVGGSAQNDFFLDTLNLDRTSKADDYYKREEVRVCGKYMPVNVVAEGDVLPFPDRSFDYVLTSHVIEHFFDPITAILEWARVARKCLFMIVPHKERTFDNVRPVTTVDELIARHEQRTRPARSEDHYSVWTPSAFVELITYMRLPILECRPVDDKRGNGFTVVTGVEPA